MLKTLQKNFRVRPLTVAVASVISLTAGSVAYAQEEADEIIITGIKASLQQAMDIKRDAIGVVDAISAEDMGKFPDTNLAESLQRITGVSIDRTNGEGSKITVRGFGGDNNMVTLNGRVMPAAGVYGGGSGSGGTVGGATRAFDFANLASESVSGVQVYKTGRADVATGGIGASVNITTAKPLDHDGFKASIGGKALADTTNRTGDDVTPEISGLVSWSDKDSGFGVGLTASHQERDSGSSDVTENNWNIGRWGTDNLYSFAPNAVIKNAPAVGQLYARPNDLRYAFSDTQRKRDNAQLTLQWAPTDRITSTLDYTYAQNEIKERRGETSAWIANGSSIDAVTFDTSGAVAAPLYIHESVGPRDNGYEQQLRQQTNTLKSVGFNLDFKATDALTLNFDAHNSKMDSLPTGPGSAGEIAATLGTHNNMTHSFDFSGYMPQLNQTINDAPTLDSNGKVVRSNGNNNGIDDAADVGSQQLRIAYADQTNEITEVRLNGQFKFEDGHFDFGIQSRAMENHNRSSTRQMTMGDWGVNNIGDVPVSHIQPYNLANFDSFNTSGAYQGGFKANAEVIAADMVAYYKANSTQKDLCVCIDPNFSTNNTLKEDTQAAYFQVGVQGELHGMKTNFLAGLRYETTDVDSSALVRPPAYLLWTDDNDFTTDYTGQALAPFRVKASYDNLLPSFDFDIAFNDALKGRFSASQTIARAPYGNLSAAVGNFSSGGGSTANGAVRTADASNPALLPLLSNNFDVSLEWYYDKSSYVSAGVFEKRVTNFIGTEKVTKQLFNIKDQTSASSPRVAAAITALKGKGVSVDDASLFTMIAILDHPADYPLGADTYTGLDKTAQEALHQAVASKYDITPNATDAVSNWLVSQPTNNKEATIYGGEFAVQHFFGESGFGVQANYTIVRGDVGYHNDYDPSISQFALLGLSDTANLVGIYEKDGWQARIAYNWRGEFLRSASQGSSKNPIYTEAYSQIDATVSYAFNENLTISLEGLNLTGEDRRDHGRTYSMVEYMVDLGPRYSLGARYNF